MINMVGACEVNVYAYMPKWKMGVGNLTNELHKIPKCWDTLQNTFVKMAK